MNILNGIILVVLLASGLVVLFAYAKTRDERILDERRDERECENHERASHERRDEREC